MLKKVNKIDDVANELIKGKMAYRYISSNVSYLDQLKQTGIIPSNIDKTYFTLDKFDNSIDAISKSQLPKSNNAKWRLEFDVNQLSGKIELPYGNYQGSNYLEPICRSYPNLGSGGATQFVTSSELKLKRMINLETKELIEFK